jgi:hypothetical protein
MASLPQYRQVTLNVTNPADGYKVAGDLFNRGVDNLVTLGDNQQESIQAAKDRNTDELIGRLGDISKLDGLQREAILRGVDPNKINMSRFNEAFGTRQGQLQTQANADRTFTQQAEENLAAAKYRQTMLEKQAAEAQATAEHRAAIQGLEGRRVAVAEGEAQRQAAAEQAVTNYNNQAFGFYRDIFAGVDDLQRSAMRTRIDQALPPELTGDKRNAAINAQMETELNNLANQRLKGMSAEERSNVFENNRFYGKAPTGAAQLDSIAQQFGVNLATDKTVEKLRAETAQLKADTAANKERRTYSDNLRTRADERIKTVYGDDLGDSVSKFWNNGESSNNVRSALGDKVSKLGRLSAADSNLRDDVVNYLIGNGYLGEQTEGQTLFSNNSMNIDNLSQETILKAIEAVRVGRNENNLRNGQ